MQNRLVILGTVLKDPSAFGISNFLYLPTTERWTLKTKCAVLPHSDIDGIPDFAKEKNLSYAMEVAAVEDVVLNAL